MTTATETTTATVSAPGFARALANAALFAMKDETIQSINAVHVEWTDEAATVSATDRYVVFREVLPLTADHDVTAGGCMIRLADVNNLVRSLKGVTNSVAPLTITVNDRYGTDTTVSFRGQTVNLQTLEGAVGEVFRKIGDQAPEDGPRDSAVVAFNPAHLAKLAKIKHDVKNMPLIFTFAGTATKPAAWTLGASISGLIMPVRISS